MANIEERVENKITPIIEDLGYSVYDVQYVKEGKEFYLRIFIEKDSGEISLDDCEKVNNAITDLLDEEDYIKDQYYLEISSTGVEKVIRKEKHLQSNIGELINAKLFKAVNSSKELVGVLKKFDNERITVEVDGVDVDINRKNITQLKKYYDWNK